MCKKDQYVAMPFPPYGMCIGKVSAIDLDTYEFEANYMAATSANEFVWRKIGDVGYEEPSWSYMNQILYVLSDPTVQTKCLPPSNESYSWYLFDDTELANARQLYSEWNGKRKQRRSNKRIKLS